VSLATCLQVLIGVCICAGPAESQWLSYGKPDLSAPLPRTIDGEPDLTGVWRTNLSAQQPPKLQPWAEAVAKRRREDLRRDSPEALCLPGPIASMGVGKIVQTPRLLLMLYSGTLYREIFLDGRDLPKDPNPDWMGYSVGRWDGDTLIVDSAGFNDRTWLNGGGVPGTEQLHITERIHRLDSGHLEVRTTYVDPSVLLAPWDVTTKFVLDDVHPLEYVCNENERDRAHMIGKASDLQSVKMEPKLLAEYAGAYEYRDPNHPEILHTWNFSVSGGELSLSDGPSTFRLITLSQTAFATENGVRYEFFRDAGGMVSHVIAYTFDGDVKANRGK
jgi:hypothetical protein